MVVGDVEPSSASLSLVANLTGMADLRDLTDLIGMTDLRDLTGSTTTWQIKLLYDGECPLCLREVNFLQRHDQGRGLVAFVDIADENYCPSDNADIDFETAMGRIHAILPDGTIVQNVEVFRRVYEILGMGWVYAITQLPVLGWLADRLYDLWADQRLRMTGRPSLQQILETRAQCESDRCRV